VRLGGLCHADRLYSEDAVAAARVVVEASSSKVKVLAADHHNLEFNLFLLAFSWYFFDKKERESETEHKLLLLESRFKIL
jgi:hypothetical protein